jgi:hypothetical protein
METSSLPPSADDFVPAWPCSRRGLPGHMHCCIRRWSFTPPFHPDPALADKAVCFLWPFSGRLAPNGGVPAPGAIRRRALWSADFPRSRLARPRPPDQPDTLSSYPIQLAQVNIFPGQQLSPAGLVLACIGGNYRMSMSDMAGVLQYL